MNEEFWIMTPLNPLFYVISLCFLLLLTAASLAVRRKSDRTRRLVLVIASVVTLIGFFAYKYALSVDRDYDRIMAAMNGFNWWGELPLHLCNINMILIPIAVMKDRRSLMSFCFFLGPLGALMALLMPGNGFEGYSILLPRMIGYYGTHFMVIIEGLALVTFGLYRPRFRDFQSAASRHRPPPESQLLLLGGDGGKLPSGAFPPLDPDPVSVPDALLPDPVPVYGGGDLWFLVGGQKKERKMLRLTNLHCMW